MSQNNQAILSDKKLVKFITKTIKKNMALQGINPTTRKGNKELELLVKNISKKKSFTNLSEATQIGERLGERIVKVSQERGKKDLDKGVIRFLASTGEILTVIGFSQKEQQTSSQLPEEEPAVEQDIAAINTSEPIEEQQTSSQLPEEEPAVKQDIAVINTPEPIEEQQKEQESEVAG